MKFVNTFILDGQAYTVQDPNAVTQDAFEKAVGDIESALDAIHDYAQSLGGGGI